MKPPAIFLALCSLAGCAAPSDHWIAPELTVEAQARLVQAIPADGLAGWPRTFVGDSLRSAINGTFREARSDIQRLESYDSKACLDVAVVRGAADADGCRPVVFTIGANNFPSALVGRAKFCPGLEAWETAADYPPLIVGQLPDLFTVEFLEKTKSTFKEL